MNKRFTTRHLLLPFFFLCVSTTTATANYQGQRIPLSNSESLLGIEGFYIKTPDGETYLFPVKPPIQNKSNDECIMPSVPGIYRPYDYPDWPCENNPINKD